LGAPVRTRGARACGRRAPRDLLRGQGPFRLRLGGPRASAGRRLQRPEGIEPDPGTDREGRPAPRFLRSLAVALRGTADSSVDGLRGVVTPARLPEAPREVSAHPRSAAGPR